MVINLIGLYLFVGLAGAFVTIRNIRDNASSKVNAEFDNLGGTIPVVFTISVFWPVIVIKRILNK